MAQHPYSLFKREQPFSLTLGGVLPSFQLAYETWGRLDADRGNAVILFTGLSASSHAKSHARDDVPGWWEAMIGPGQAIDTDRFFVLCINHLGGCFGSTGPSSISPETQTHYGPDFPPLLIQDLVDAAVLVLDMLGIQQVYASVGTSMGGMLAMELAARHAHRVQRLISISASGRPGPQSIAFRYLQRRVILADPFFAGGRYYDEPNKPSESLAVAREIGNITYRSREEFNERFGRSRTANGYNFGPDFQVESYLNHMGRKLSSDFDPNSFLFLTKAMDLYSLGYEFSSYEEGVLRIKAKSLMIGVSTDMLFPPDEQEAVVRILQKVGRDVSFKLLESKAGHDAFLVEVDWFRPVVRDFLES
ncbi:homoserine O-acetyltransferase MetX [Acanthopleuribacter pedis]|uniref:Serine O-succinyltransferase n=1 Tax=Acanthopleuribacter pedis TaxID=442870 RepID=A0A8J7QD51_9BACT|nr:homoserine O-acetyltransferase [Acanthopleuribacter pedis]MBO1318836.1 homoserine O-acetyltransferase [Acanthopleuribacter pedis]